MKKSVFLFLAGIIITTIMSSIILSIQTDFDDSSSESNNFIIKKIPISLDTSNPIKVGILHSLSGTMAISESAVVDSTLLAVEEINQQGGILGREVLPIIKDGRSEGETFAKEAEKLIVEEDVSVVFGGWTSDSRKTMKPVFEEYDHLLFYPVQYEGLENSPNIIYTGASPNQQVLPAVEWAYEELGTSFFLVGSDYVFPRSANEIIKGKIHELGGIVVGEEYKLLGEKNFEDIVDKIVKTNPDVILNTINGDSNLGFFSELRERGISSSEIPTISFSIAENEIRQLGTENMAGDYASWNYFQSLENQHNKMFVENFQKKYGSDRVVDDPMEAGYLGVYLYAKAVEKSGTTKISEVHDSLKGITFHAPEGPVGVDPDNQHLVKAVRIGQILPDGQFKIVSSSEQPIRPEPFPDYKSEEQWNEFLLEMYEEWDENWANQG